MSQNHAADLVLWIVQGFLALFFLLGSLPKLAGRGLQRWTGFADLPRAEVLFIGIAEVLGGVGLILPMAAGILPWLTPLAAIGLTAVALMASGFHVRANEHLQAVETVLWAAIAAVIAIGRWPPLTPHLAVQPVPLVTALAVLVPAVIINLAVILRRPVAPSSASSARIATR